MLLLGVHNHRIHLDESIGVSMISIWITEEYKVIRTRDEDILKTCDMLIDVGLKNDGIKYFDHHQYQYGKSAAGLIWDMIQKKHNIIGCYPKIDKLINIIDKADTGEEEPPDFFLSFVVNTMNADNHYGEEQEEAFTKIVIFLKDILLSMKKEQEEADKAEAIIEKCEIVISKNNKKGILFPDCGINGWGSVINGENPKYNDIDFVVWKNKKDKQFKSQIPPIKEGSIYLVNDGFIQSNKAIFIHQNKFFSVWHNLEDLLDNQ